MDEIKNIADNMGDAGMIKNQEPVKEKKEEGANWMAPKLAAAAVSFAATMYLWAPQTN